MKIIDHVYGGTLKKIVEDIIHQVKDSQEFLADKNYTDEDKEGIKEEIEMKVEMITPAITSMHFAFIHSVTDEMREFVKDNNIEIPTEEEWSKRNVVTT